MNRIFLLIGILLVLVIGSSTILMSSHSPEELIIGKWKEVSWEYEKVNNANGSMEIDDEVKHEICQNMVIHKAEIWEFDKNRRLSFYENNIRKEVLDWNLKGRGHILELEHRDSRIEDYQIQEITKDSLIVHFSFDLQVRGIVKMIFKRIHPDQYAQKI